MASRYFALDRGETEFQVHEGSSTQSKAFEFAVDLAKSTNAQEAIIALEAIKNWLLGKTTSLS